MPTANIEVVEVPPTDKQELWQVMQEYLRELDELEGKDTLPGQEIDYPHWENYWNGTAGYHKFWVTIGDGKVGFILFRDMPAEEWGSVPPPMQITEFCILRPFRSREIGSSILKFLFEDFRQRKEMLTWDCLQSNTRAEKLYDRVVAEYGAAAGADWTCEKNEFESDAGRMYRYTCVPL
jgi:predicted acetyltransferase